MKIGANSLQYFPLSSDSWTIGDVCWSHLVKISRSRETKKPQKTPLVEWFGAVSAPGR